MATKDIKEFTLDEIVHKATKGLPPQDTDRSPSMINSGDILKIVADFKIAQKQDEINNKLLKLTKWLLGLTIALVMLTLGLVLLTVKLISPH